MSLGGIPLRTIANPLRQNRQLNDKKIIVFVQLFGGNDGLNTLVPYEDSAYYKGRPTLALRKNELIRIHDTLGFHPSLASFDALFKEGKVSIIQNVGYEQPNRSHFRSTDIWNSASDAEEYVYDGWAARYLSSGSKGRLEELTYPLAVELGWAGSMLIEEHKHPHGLFMNSLEEYEKLSQKNGNVPFDPADPLKDAELEYIKTIALQSNRFTSKIKVASDKGRNKVAYPDTFLGRQLAIVAKLIAGGLETGVYVTKLNGFDTHYLQLEPHAALLSQFSDAIYAFQKDLDALAVADQVSTLVYSEFGRRVQEGGFGTDHGTAAPIFVVGDSVRGGIIGRNPNLTNLDSNGDLVHKYDFRQVYTTILNDHLGFDATTIMNKEFTTLPIYKNSIDPFPESAFVLDNIYPNPFQDETSVAYRLFERSLVELVVFDPRGVLVAPLVNEYQHSGAYVAAVNIARLPPATYVCSMKVKGVYESKRIIKVT